MNTGAIEFFHGSVSVTFGLESHEGVVMASSNPNLCAWCHNLYDALTVAALFIVRKWRDSSKMIQEFSISILNVAS
jgi:hypothetical protein